MINMKASQKGTKLNDIRYFRQPRPYTRKTIPKIQLIPNFIMTLKSVIDNVAEDQVSPTNHRRSFEKSTKSRCSTVHCDQRSREIAWISYASDTDEESEDLNHAKENNRDELRIISEKKSTSKEIFISQSETANLKSKASSETKKFEKTLAREKEVQVEMKLLVAEKNVGVEELEIALAVSPECSDSEEEFKREIAHEMPQVYSNRHGSDIENSFWFRYGGIRKILHFFGNLLGKRDSESHDNEATRIMETRRFLNKGVNNFSNQARSKKLNSSMKNREKKSSKWKSVPRKTDTAIKKPENVEFSGLARQIINTRDERLRANFMKHEMRARKLEEENRRYRRILEEKLKTRQMSSPLHY